MTEHPSRPSQNGTGVKIRREFLDWDLPALPEAANRLAGRYRQGEVLDLSAVVVVVPGQRAGRRLRELLAFLAEDEQLRLTPPEIVTEGRLPEMLYTPKQPFANEVVQDLAWSRALQDVPAATRRHVVPHPPEAAQALRWLELGAVLRRLHVELAADGFDFATVHRIGPRLADFSETDRWAALALVQQRYLELLDQQQLWDIQTARLKAIEFREIASERDIVLLGTVDLNNTLRHMLLAIAERVTAFIAAPEELADRFDEYGCLVPNTWCAATVPLRVEQRCQVEGPIEQADAVAEWLAGLDGRFQRDEVVIGVPDESLVPQLQRQLGQVKVPARWVEGVRLGSTAPYRLLAAAVQFAGRRRYEDLAALVRHPDLEAWLQPRRRHPPRPPLRKGGREVFSLPAQLDEFYNVHLPSRVYAGPALANGNRWADLAPALQRIDAWLDDASALRPLRSWGVVFRDILGAIYSSRILQLDNLTDEILHRTIAAIVEECAKLDELPEALDTVALPAEDAFQIALAPLADKYLPPPADPDAVEILGWLELPLDDSPALVVTSFNEGFVPQSAGADAFLPDRLRRELGLLHNERRYARDAYATSVLCHSRAELRVLFARRDTDKNPLQPSRLIFACPDDALIKRAQQFFGASEPPAPQRTLLLAPDGPIIGKSLFERPRSVPSGRKCERISVTTFKAYLACPYRFYLTHVLKLKARDDSGRELEGTHFGSLLHRVLGAFGRDSDGPRHSEREDASREYLQDHVSALAKDIYGEQHRPAIRLQLEQARRRLDWFASCQAKQVREGWRIVFAENDEEHGIEACCLDLDEPITLVGRIDRIDYHEATKTICILDYKTADKAEHPEKTHRPKERWLDLQLPLYRHLWRALGLAIADDCTVQLGYFNLPKQLEATGISPASWDDSALREADDVAREVIRNLRAEVYEPMAWPAPKYSEALAAICLENRDEAPALADDDEEGDQE